MAKITQYCKVISLQLKLKKKKQTGSRDIPCPFHSVETQPEGTVYEPEYSPSGLNLGLLSPRTVSNTVILFLSHPACGNLLRHP